MSIITFAKPAFDVGVFTNQLSPMRRFWAEDIGLVYQERLAVGGGIHQYRHAVGESVFKLNHARDSLPDAPPSPIERLWIADHDATAPTVHVDPDGNTVCRIPPGHDGITQLQVDLATSDIDTMHRFYRDTLGFEALDAHRLRCGVSIVRLMQSPRSQPMLAARLASAVAAVGFRYLTLQVRDVERVHRQVLDAGGVEGRAPVRLGDVARISFVRDPEGTWIELSQRRSLTGSLD